jgi:hypothetical protein
MSRYLFLGRFVEIIKEIYSKVTKLIIYFDPRNPIEKTKYSKLQKFSYGIVIVDCNKKRALDYSKLIEICSCETDDEEIVDTCEIVITLSEGDNITNFKKFTIKDKKIIKFFPNQIVSNVNNTLLNYMIGQKKKGQRRTANQDDFNDIMVD